MHRPKRWNIAEADLEAAELAGRLKASPLLAQVLINRGMRRPEDCQAFLRPSLSMLHSPAAMPGLPRAAERIARAIRDRQKIVIYGDYDVDGITASAILWHAIRVLGGTAEFYVPHRIEEGYGLNREAIIQLCEQGAGLIVSVDCGITAIEPAQAAAERGVDLIITDHHEWRTEPHDIAQANGERPGGKPLLPACYAIVHPRLAEKAGDAYPNPHLCGAGVAFKLAWGIGQEMNGGSAARVSDEFRAFLVDATGLAALGTIADVVPLVGENRILAQFGLAGLEKSGLRGLKALIASAGLTGAKLDSYDVGFRLAPRLNACGRMGHARLAIEMLTSAGETQANEIATYLEQQNKQRQAMEKKILASALEQVEQNHFDADDCFALVLGSEEWHPGVIGIVASRLVDRLHRPTLMIAMTNGHGKGSGRSIPGFHLTRALDACRPLLSGYGGHEMAAGLQIETAHFQEFREAFCAHAKSIMTPAMLIPELQLESLANLKDMTPALVKDLQRLGPFGHSNRRPLLAVRGLELASPPRRVGNTGDHLQLSVRQGNSTMKCIAFNYGQLFDRLQKGTTIDLAIEPCLNEFNGHINVELEVKDLQFVREENRVGEYTHPANCAIETT